MEKTFFDCGKTDKVILSNGTRLGLPVRFHDWSMIMAHFPAPTAKVRKLLPSNYLRPAQVLPGKAIVTLTAIEYRDIADLAPYQEFRITIPVLYRPTVNIPGLPLLFPNLFKRFGVYIRHMPVTTEEARVCGVEIWGEPRFMAEISFQESGRVRCCQLRAGGKDILTLEVQKTAVHERSFNHFTFTVKDGHIRRTRTQFAGEIGVSLLKGGASYTLGDHPIAGELRALEMGKTSVERIYAPKVHSITYEAGELLPL